MILFVRSSAELWSKWNAAWIRTAAFCDTFTQKFDPNCSDPVYTGTPEWTIKQLPLVEDLQPDSWEPLSAWVDEPCLIFTKWLYKVNPEERNVMNAWRGFYSSCKETGNTGKHLSVQWSNRTQDSNMEQNTSPDPSKHKSGWQTINQYNVSSM